MDLVEPLPKSSQGTNTSWCYWIMPLCTLKLFPCTPWQRLMDQVLRPHREYVTAYINDIVIHGSE